MSNAHKQFELSSIVLVEVDSGVPGFLPVIKQGRYLSTEISLEAAAATAARHAESNMGDGNYCLKDNESREVARIEVRRGMPSIIIVTDGKTPAEELASLFAKCPFCEARAILIPCACCGARRCSKCLMARACCKPRGEGPLAEWDSDSADDNS